jgi:hypothetical protein
MLRSQLGRTSNLDPSILAFRAGSRDLSDFRCVREAVLPVGSLFCRRSTKVVSKSHIADHVLNPEGDSDYDITTNTTVLGHLLSGMGSSLPFVIQVMLVITRQLVTFAICSKRADVRGTKETQCQSEKPMLEILHTMKNAQIKELNRSNRSIHALNDAH